jgi:transcriptional regulator with XRE-family HTH domain
MSKQDPSPNLPVENDGVDRTHHQKERYRELLVELLTEEGGVDKHGSKSRAARRLGIDQSYVSKILTGERSAGLESIDAAVTKLRIQRAYFDAPLGATYRSFRGQQQGPALHPALAAFLATPQGSQVTPDELEVLRAAHYGKGRVTRRWHELLLFAIREGYSPDEAAESASVTSSARESATKKGGHPPREHESG